MHYSIAFAAACSLAGSATVQAALTHRYNFAANANDLIGSANGTLVNSATVSGGKLQLNNPNFSGPSTARGYLSISPSVLPSSGSATIEQWFTFTGSGFYTEAYSFTNSNNDANQPGATVGQYLMHTISAPQPGAPTVPNTGGSHVGQTLAGYTTETDAFETTPGLGAGGGGYLDDGGTYMATTVIDGTAGTLSYYLNGILQQTIAAIPLSSYSFTNLFLGRSAFGGDNATSGVVDEFRVYNAALGTAGILADFTAGPDVVVLPEPTTLAMLAAGGLLLRRRR